jgi:hypothetical protein
MRKRFAAQDREVLRRMRVAYAPFHGLTVFVLSLIVFSIFSQMLSWIGMLDRPTTALLVPIAAVGLFSLAPVPDVIPTDGGWQLLVSMVVSFVCGWLVHRLRPQWSTRRWWFATTALLVTLSGIAHLVWRKLGHDWPEWLAYIRDLA